MLEYKLIMNLFRQEDLPRAHEASLGLQAALLIVFPLSLSTLLSKTTTCKLPIPQFLFSGLNFRLTSVVNLWGKGWRGRGGRGAVIFSPESCRCRKTPAPEGHVSLASWPWQFLLRSSFVFSGYNLCDTWRGDNADDPVFDAQSSLSRCCCPSLGPRPSLVGERKKKEEKQWRQI